MSVLFSCHDAFEGHRNPPGHPESPRRLDAVVESLHRFHLADAVIPFEPRRATVSELGRVHPRELVDGLEQLSESGGGPIDADTSVSSASFEAAVRAAGAGLDAIERVSAGEASRAFCAVRPPGHHATPERSMGFCLLNNVGVAAAALAEQGERVAIIDFDAHHGNGTQDAFYEDERVLFCSIHQSPLYPGTGPAEEVGDGDGRGKTVNVPLPAGATGDVYRSTFETIIAPAVATHGPTWLFVSAGFDAHRADPLTSMALTSGDFAAMSRDVLEIGEGLPSVWFLEGGYDLEALTDSVGASLGAMIDLPIVPEPETVGGPGREEVGRVRAVRHAALDVD